MIDLELSRLASAMKTIFVVHHRHCIVILETSLNDADASAALIQNITEHLSDLEINNYVFGSDIVLLLY